MGCRLWGCTESDTTEVQNKRGVMVEAGRTVRGHIQVRHDGGLDLSRESADGERWSDFGLIDQSSNQLSSFRV